MVSGSHFGITPSGIRLTEYTLNETSWPADLVVDLGKSNWMEWCRKLSLLALRQILLGLTAPFLAPTPRLPREPTISGNATMAPSGASFRLRLPCRCSSYRPSPYRPPHARDSPRTARATGCVCPN